MTFTREQKKVAYKKLSPEVQDFIMSNETTELIGNYLKGFGLSEEQIVSADSEILYAMFGLQTLSEAINNIARLSNRDVGSFSELKINLGNNIFNKIQKNVSESFTSIKQLSQNKIDKDTAGKIRMLTRQKNSIDEILKSIK